MVTQDASYVLHCHKDRGLEGVLRHIRPTQSCRIDASREVNSLASLATQQMTEMSVACNSVVRPEHAGLSVQEGGSALTGIVNQARRSPDAGPALALRRRIYRAVRAISHAFNHDRYRY